MTWMVTLILLLQPVICTLLLGTGITLWFWRSVPKTAPEQAMFACVSTLVGFGSSGVVFFFWLNLWPQSLGMLRIMDMVAMALGVVMINVRTRSIRQARAAAKRAEKAAADGQGTPPSPPPSPPVTASNPCDPETCPPRWLVGSVIVTLLIALLATLTHFAHNPHGDFDAVSMWNARARYVYIDPANWHRAFDSGVHSDYPLLLPLTIARLWLYIGDVSLIVPQGIALASVAMTLTMMCATLSRVRGTSSGLLAMLATIALPFFILQGALQYADAPTMLLTTGAMCMLIWSTAWSIQLLPVAGILCGLLAGINANIKNEGELIFVGLSIGMFLVSLRSRSIVVVVRSLTAFLGGAAVFLVFLWLCKSQIQGENDVVSAHAKELMKSQFLDITRHRTIWANVLAMIFLNRLYFYPENWANVAAWIMPVWVVIDWSRARIGGWRPGPERLAMWAIFLAVGCVCAGYYAVYLITPYDLDWHLRTSCARLFLHLWPCVVLWAFLLLPPQLNPPSK